MLPLFYIFTKCPTKILPWPLIAEDTYYLNTRVTRWFALDIYNFQPLFSPSVVIKTRSITYERFVISSFKKLTSFKKEHFLSMLQGSARDIITF